MEFEKLPRFKEFHMEILRRIPEWAGAYEVGEEAIRRQILIAHCWCQNNKRKAPKSDILRFLNSWMGKAKTMGSLTAKALQPLYKDEAPAEDMTVDEMKAIREQNFKHQRLSQTVEKEPELKRCAAHQRLSCFDCEMAEIKAKHPSVSKAGA